LDDKTVTAPNIARLPEKVPEVTFCPKLLITLQLIFLLRCSKLSKRKKTKMKGEKYSNVLTATRPVVHLSHLYVTVMRCTRGKSANGATLWLLMQRKCACTELRPTAQPALRVELNSEELTQC